MRRSEIREDRVPIAVEDRFVIFSFGSGRYHCPHTDATRILARMVDRLASESNYVLTPVLDFRGVKTFYSDIQRFALEFSDVDATVLVTKGQEDWWRADSVRESNLYKEIPTLSAIGVSYATSHFDIADMAERDGMSLDEFDYFYERFVRHVNKLRRNSLLVEYSMSFADDRIHVTPYHGRALHEVETSRNSVVIGRPGVIAKASGAVLSKEINELEMLINEPGVKELQI